MSSQEAWLKQQENIEKIKKDKILGEFLSISNFQDTISI